MFEYFFICWLLDGGIIDEGDLYIVMEYVEGVFIIEFCCNEKFLIREWLELFFKVCEGVIYVYVYFVVYCDLKLLNILVNY